MGSTVTLTSGMTIDRSEELPALMYRAETIDIFSSVDALTIDGNNIAPDTTTQVSFTLAPEPATATLSPPALAALAARTPPQVGSGRHAPCTDTSYRKGGGWACRLFWPCIWSEMW